MRLVPIAATGVVGSLTLALAAPDPGEALERAVYFDALGAAFLAVLAFLSWIRWTCFGDAQAAHLGLASACLSLATLAITFGHGAWAHWDEVITRSILVGATVAAVGGLELARRAPEVDTRIRMGSIAGVGVAALAAVSLLAWPVTASAATDPVIVGTGIVLAVAGTVACMRGRCGVLMPWVSAAIGIVGLGQLVHALPGSHEQFDLMLVRASGVLVCVVGALVVVHRTFTASESRAARARRARDEARLARVAAERRTQMRTHELRNAVLALDGATTVAMRREDGQALDGLRDAVEAELDRVRSLLDRDVREDVGGEKFDVAQIVRRQVVLARSAGAAIQMDAAGAVGAYGDAGEAAEIVQNLLVNVERHAAGPHPVEVWIVARATVAEVVVADRGPGVPEGLRASLLAAPVPSEVGAGLGLHICATLARARGGELRLEDRPGGGTLVRYLVPRSPSSIRRPRAGALSL